MQRLGFNTNTTFEHRKLPVDLCEVVIKWELQRIKDETDASGSVGVGGGGVAAGETLASLDAVVDSPATPGSSGVGGLGDPKKVGYWRGIHSY